MDVAAGRYGVADGASEGCFTGDWARLLVESFVRGGEITSWPTSLPALQEQWDAEVRAQDLPWYAETGVRQGACSTFLGLVLQESPLPHAGEGLGVRASHTALPPTMLRTVPGEGPQAVPEVREAPCRWQAVAVGDACLLHTRGGTLLRAFPLDRSEQFHNFPKLVGSRMPVEAVRARQTLWIDGCGHPGDRLWMMTDALAQFCLGAIEAGGNPWDEWESLVEVVQNLPSPADHATHGARRGAGGEGIALPFPACRRGAGGEGGVQPHSPNAPFSIWIQSLRDAGRLRNDDVTLLAIEL